MRKIILLCLLLTACASQDNRLFFTTPTPPLPTQPLPHEPMCDYLFNSWEQEKERGGMYFRIGEMEGLIFLTSFEVGLHELCHFADMERDYPSQTQTFKDAVNKFLTTTGSLQDKFTFWLEIGLGMDDIYAELCKISLIGELPLIFEQFFDDRSEDEE